MDCIFSIIIPEYNSEKWIKRCLDSVVRAIKDRKDVEVIVIDDGSTDDSVSICKQYPNIQLIQHKSNKGVSEARNSGLSASTGKWIMFLDADDCMNIEGINTMVDATNRFPEENIIQFNHYRYYAEINKLVLKYINRSGRYNCFERLPKMWMMVWNKIYKSNFLNQNNLKFESGMQFGEDEIFNLNCIGASPYIRHLHDTVVTRHFDNKMSLARSADENKLFLHTENLCNLIRNSTSAQFKGLVRNIIAKHWASKLYAKVFGGVNVN